MKISVVSLALSAFLSLAVRAETPMRAILLKLAVDLPAGSATFDTNVWNGVTARAAANGIDTLVLSLGDGIDVVVCGSSTSVRGNSVSWIAGGGFSMLNDDAYETSAFDPVAAGDVP